MLDEEPITYHREISAPPEFRSYKIEFITGPFKHNTSVACLLGPCILPLLALSGKFTLTLLLCGMVFAYILDYLNFKGWTLVTLWATLCSVWLSLYFSNILLIWQSLFNVFIVVNASWFILLIGVWGTVQFLWLQVYSPDLSLVCERVLIGLTPMVLLPLMYTNIVGILGVRNSATVMSLAMCAVHHLMYKRKKSSWKVALVPAATDEEFVQGKLECILFTICLPIIPLVLFIITRHRILTLSVLNGLSIASLVAIPMFYLFYDPPKTLWFLFPNSPTGGPPSKAQLAASPLMKIRRLILLVSYLCIQHWFQQGILASRYGHLLLGMPPPYNTVAVTVGFYCLSLTAYLSLQLVRMSRKNELGIGMAGRWIAVLFLSIAASTAFAMVLGVPRFILPFSALAAACITAYCLDRRNFNNFVLFATCSSMMLVWWMWKSFSFLEMELPILMGSVTITLQHLSLLIVALFVLSCMLFPVSFHAHPGAPEARIFFCFLLFHHACLFAFVEHVLYAQEEAFYSPIYVVLSTGLGCFMMWKIYQNGKQTYTQASIVMAPYVSKLVVFIAVSSTVLEDHVTSHERAYLGAGVVVLFLQAVISAAILLIFEFELQNNKKRARPNLAILYSISSFVVVLLSRGSIVAALIHLTSGGSALTEISSSRFAGVTIFVWGLTLLPVSFKYMKHLQFYRRVTFVVIVIGAILGLLSPAWGTLHTGTNIDEDIRIYQAPWWIGWTGTLAGALLICTLFNVIPLPHTTPVRYTWWTAITTLSAITFSETFLPYVQFHTTVCICVIFALVVLTIDLAHFPKTTNDFNPALVVYLAMVAVSLVVYIAIQQADFQHVTQVYYILSELYHVSTVAVISLIAASNILVSIIIKAKLSGVPLVRSVYTSTAKDVNFMYVPAKATLPLGLIVNASCLTGFLCMAMLNVLLNESNVFVFVLLSGLLLLLHQDAYLFATFNPEKQRYIPALVNVETLLTMIAIVELHSAYFLGRMSWDLLMVALLIPSHLVLWNYLNTFKTPRLGSALLSVIFGTVAILGTTMPPVRWLALVGVAGLGGIFFATALGSKQQGTIL